MKTHDYSNGQLAKDYFRVSTINVPDVEYQLAAKNWIRNCKENLSKIYQKEGNLDTLKIPNFPKIITLQAKGLLELILKEGIEQTERLMTEKANSKMRISAKISRLSPLVNNSIRTKKTSDENNPFFERAVRLYEQD